MNCPQPAAIASLVDGRLSPVEMADIEKHLDDCSQCADLLAVALSSQGPTMRQSLQSGGVVPLGARLGRYEVRRWLGRGGMGDVYEGFDSKLHRAVAIKVLRERGDESQSGQKRLEREARTLARLSNPNVVTVLDIGFYAGRVFLVMELVDGPTLATWLRATPRSWRQILEAFLDAGDGLAAAHDVGVIHRDFKPQNVLVGDDGRVRVSDFGLARSAESGRDIAGDAGPRSGATAEGGHDTVTGSGTVVGTPRYMAPEQSQKLHVDARADQFSFCVALFEALYGRHPFVSDGGREPTEAVSEAVRGGGPEPPPRRTDVPRAIADVLMRGLARNPEDRFPSLRMLLVALRDGADSPRRRWPLAMAVATVSAMALTAGGVAWFKHRGSDMVLEPTGQPADWTSSRIVFHVPDRIHCLMRISDRTIRVGWGTPRQIADVDLATGTRRPTELVPESYRYGCPELSPDGKQLIYEGYDQKNRPHIFYAANPQGRDAEAMVSSAAPSFHSEPLWLSSNKEFVFDQDLQHPAVFSLSKNTSTIIPNSDRMTLSQVGFFKSVSQTGDHIAVLQSRTTELRILVCVYSWPTLDLEAMFGVAGPAGLAWRFGDAPSLLYGRVYGSPDQLVVFDSTKRQLRRLATVSGRDIVEFLQVARATAGIATRRTEANVWWTDSHGTDHRIPRDDPFLYSKASLTEDGDILLVRSRGYSWNTLRFRPADGSFRDLTDGPYDWDISALPNREWLMTRNLPNGVEIHRCSEARTGGSQCRLIAKESSAMNLSAAPGGKLFVYETVTAEGAVVRLSSVEGGPVVDLVNDSSCCQLLWSSPSTVWISRRKGTGYEWTEMNAETKKPTGKTVPGDRNCLNGELDPNPPVSAPVRIVFTDDWDVRLHSVPTQ